MEDLKNENEWLPEDEVNFDGTELMEVLGNAVRESTDNGEYFPYVWVRLPGGGLADVIKVTLVKGTQSDGTHNFEIVFDLGSGV